MSHLATIEKDVLNFICKNGKQTGRSLAWEFQTNKRSIRMIINSLRREGRPICSDNKGYWYSCDENEIDQTITTLDALILGISSARQGLTIAKRNIAI
jgi:hypothetical protein